MSTVVSQHLNFGWPSGGSTQVYITQVQGRANDTVMKMQSVAGPAQDSVETWYENIVVDGYFFNAVTGLQFEPHGVATSAPTTEASGALTPLTPVMPSQPTWFVDSVWPTYLTIAAQGLADLFTANDLQREVWYKVVLSYDNQYLLVPIQFDLVSMDYSLTGTDYKFAVSPISGDYAPVNTWSNILVDGVTPSYEILGGIYVVTFPKTDPKPSWVQLSADSPVPGAAATAYANNLPQVWTTSINANELTITGDYLNKWDVEPYAGTITRLNGNTGYTTLTYVSVGTLRVTSTVGWGGNPILTINGTKATTPADIRTIWQIDVRGADKSY